MTTNLKALAKRGIDALNHSGVQPWSAGPLFPAVIAKVERYDERPLYLERTIREPRAGFMYEHWAVRKPALSDRLQTQWWELTLDGRTEQYATREDAEMVARELLRDPAQRAAWNRRFIAYCDEVHEHLQYLAACERSVREGV